MKLGQQRGKRGETPLDLINHGKSFGDPYFGGHIRHKQVKIQQKPLNIAKFFPYVLGLHLKLSLKVGPPPPSSPKFIRSF